MNQKKSLGLVETWGIVGAIHAADAGTKAANVEMLGYELNRAGFATVKFVGDVGAVQAAVAAGVAAASDIAEVVSHHVIPRPAEDMAKLTVESPDNIPPLGPKAAPEQPAKPKAKAAKKPAAKKAAPKKKAPAKNAKTEKATEDK